MIATFLFPPLAWAGGLDGEIALDGLYADSSSTAIASGPEETLSAAELGIRIRGEILEEDDRLVVGVDYRGREPVAGTFATASQHLVVRADVAWRTDTIEVGLGRFTAPSAVSLTLDGARGTLSQGGNWATAFFGRRALSTSRRNIGLSSLLPVAGIDLGRRTEGYRAQASIHLAGDQMVLGTDQGAATEDVLGGGGVVRIAVSALDDIAFGGQISAANQATYVVGPDAGQLVTTVQALSLYNGFAWGSWRPSRQARLDADVGHQQAILAPSPDVVDLVDPSFTDLRLKGAFGVAAATGGWLRPDLRVRLRPGRTEIRAGGGIDGHLAQGPFARGRLWAENIVAPDDPDDVGLLDRVLWQAGVGYEAGPAQIEIGASFVDRAAGPVSSRSADPTNASPLSSEDLSPFALEAQNVAYLRGFWTSRRAFAGVDLEANVEQREVRAFLQIGLLGDVSW